MIVKRPDNFFPDLSGYVDMAEDAAHSMKERLSGIFSRSAPIPEPAHTSPGSGEEIETPTEEAAAAPIVGDPNVADEHGQTPLFVAVANNQREEMNTLLEKRADPNIAEEHGLTPILKAVFNCNIGAIKTLHKYRADLNITENHGFAPIHLAVEMNNIFAIKILHEYKADLNKPDENGLTPIFRAARDNRIESIIVLLEDGADPDLADGCGNTPRSQASEEAGKIFEGFDTKRTAAKTLLSRLRYFMAASGGPQY